MDQTEEQPKGRLLRLIFNAKLKFPHVNPRCLRELEEATFKCFKITTSNSKKKGNRNPIFVNRNS